MNAKVSGKKSPIRLEFLVGCIWVVILAAIAGGVAALFLVPGLNPFTPQPTPTPVIPTDTPTPTATSASTPQPTFTAAFTPTETQIPTPAVIDLGNATTLAETGRLGRGVIGQIVYSPDSARIAVASSTGIRIHNARTLELLAEFASEDWVSSLAYSPDGKTIAAWLPDGSVSLWNSTTAKLVKTLSVPSEGGTIRVTADGLHNVTFSADGGTLAAGQGDGSIHLWDVSSGDLLMTIKGADTSIAGIAISPDGKFLASTALLEGRVRVWEVISGELAQEFSFEGSPALSVNFSPDSSLLAISGATIARNKETVNSLVSLWSASDWKKVREFKLEGGGASRVVFSPDSLVLAFRSGRSTLAIYDTGTGDLIREFIGHTGVIHALAYAPDGSTVISGGADGLLSVWDVTNAAQISFTQEYNDRLNDIAISPDGNTLVTASDNGGITLWNAQTRERIFSLTSPDSPPTSLAFSVDGRLLAAGFEDDSVHVWNAGDGSELFTLTGHEGDVNDVEFSPDGSLLASGSDDKTIIAWNMADGTQKQKYEGYAGGVTHLAFTPDGIWLLGSSQEGEIKLWDVARGFTIYAVNENALSTITVISPDKRTYISTNLSKIKVRSLDKGNVLYEIESDQIGMESLAYSQDGAILISGGADGAAKVWGVNSAFPLGALEGHNGGIVRILFTPDKTTLITASFDGTVRYWTIIP
jgi:WD40 repeat protein